VELTVGRLDQARAALEPYRWRELTPVSLVRRVLAAVDPAVGDAEPGLTDSSGRVEPLVAAFDGIPWRTLTATTVCRLLLDALDDRIVAEKWFEIELAWLLENGA
jgi:hypothetical protein